MELKDLKEYLEMIVDMERNKLLLDNTIESVKAEMSKLAISKVMEVPQKPKEIVADVDDGKVASSVLIGIFGIPVLIFGIILIVAGIEGCIEGELVGLAIFMIIVGLFIALFGLSIMAGFSAPFEASAKRKKCDEENRKNLSDYNRKMNEYNEKRRLDNKRVKNEDIVKENLGLKVKSLEKQRYNCNEVMTSLYSLDIVFPKYRNFTMMCTIYEHISSGRCYALEGPDGAYNILEMEIRMDRIIVQLDLILSNLEQIKANQYMIYGAIQENNRQQRLILESTDQILSCVRNMNSNIQKSTEELKASMESIDKNSALTAYAAERSQKELEYMNTMNYLQSKYCGTGFNQPPSWQ